MAQAQLGILDQLPDQHILDTLPDQTGNEESMLSKIGHRLLDVNYGRPNAPKLVGPGNVKIPGVETAGKYIQNKLINSGNYYLGALGGLIGYGSSMLADAPSPMNSGIKAGEGATGSLKERLANIAKQETESLTPPLVRPKQLGTSSVRGLLGPATSNLEKPAFVGAESGIARGQVLPANAPINRIAELAGKTTEGHPSTTALGEGFDPEAIAEQERLANLNYTAAEQYPGTRLNIPGKTGMNIPVESGRTELGFKPQTEMNEYPYNVVPNQLRPRTAQSNIARLAPEKFQDIVKKATGKRPTPEITKTGIKIGNTTFVSPDADETLIESAPEYYVPNLEDTIPDLPSAIKIPRQLSDTGYPQSDKPIIDITPTKGENTYAKVKELAPGEMSYNPLNLKEKLGIGTPSALNQSELPNAPSTAKMLINTPKSIMASTDLSAPLRQGMPLITRKEWWNSLVPMVKAMTSEEAYQGIQTAIREDANYGLMKSAKLALTDTAEHEPREEAFLNSYAEHIPGIGPVIRASDRAYTGFLNKLRADTFNSLLNDAKNLGYDDSIAGKIAKYVNVSTGRGSLGQFEKYADDLNTVMFSPRMMASRLTMLNPFYYWQQPAFLRKEALKSLLSVAGAGSLFTGIGVLAGGKTSLDPTNTDFMKLKIGDTRIDPYAGFQQYVVAARRLMPLIGATTSSVSGKTTEYGIGYRSKDRLDTIGTFMRNKESPAASFVHDMITQKDSLGKPIQLSNEVISRITPMMLQDLYDIAKSDPKLLPLGVFGNFGMGVQTYSK